MNTILGKRICNLRKERDYTQEYVAKQIGMSRQKYARLESGMGNITLDTLVKLAELFDVEVNDITKVLDYKPLTQHRVGVQDEVSVDTVYEMLDLFYANKHVYDRLHYKDEL